MEVWGGSPFQNEILLLTPRALGEGSSLGLFDLCPPLSTHFHPEEIK